MSEATTLLLAIMCGLASGGFFFGGLWLATGWILRSQHRIALAITSFALRSAVAVALALLAVNVAGAWGVAAYLAGFTLVRFLLVGMAGRKRANNA